MHFLQSWALDHARLPNRPPPHGRMQILPPCISSTASYTCCTCYTDKQSHKRPARQGQRGPQAARPSRLLNTRGGWRLLCCRRCNLSQLLRLRCSCRVSCQHCHCSRGRLLRCQHSHSGRGWLLRCQHSHSGRGRLLCCHHLHHRRRLFHGRRHCDCCRLLCRHHLHASRQRRLIYCNRRNRNCCRLLCRHHLHGSRQRRLLRCNRRHCDCCRLLCRHHLHGSRQRRLLHRHRCHSRRRRRRCWGWRRRRCRRGRRDRGRRRRRRRAAQAAGRERCVGLVGRRGGAEVGAQALPVDVHSGGGHVLAHSQDQAAAVAQLVHGLHATGGGEGRGRRSGRECGRGCGGQAGGRRTRSSPVAHPASPQPEPAPACSQPPSNTRCALAWMRAPCRTPSHPAKHPAGRPSQPVPATNLDEPLAVRAPACQHGAAVVAQRARQDLAGARGVVVDQDHQRGCELREGSRGIGTGDWHASCGLAVDTKRRHQRGCEGRGMARERGGAAARGCGARGGQGAGRTRRAGNWQPALPPCARTRGGGGAGRGDGRRRRARLALGAHNQGVAVQEQAGHLAGTGRKWGRGQRAEGGWRTLGCEPARQHLSSVALLPEAPACLPACLPACIPAPSPPTSIPSDTRPPLLSRRSSTRRCAPAACSRCTAASVSRCGAGTQGGRARRIGRQAGRHALRQRRAPALAVAPWRGRSTPAELRTCARALKLARRMVPTRSPPAVVSSRVVTGEGSARTGRRSVTCCCCPSNLRTCFNGGR